MQKTTEHPYNGVLIIDKPSGITSHDVVDRVRRTLKMRKVGHAGTLDPNATGLMLILLGNGTKASQYLISKDKSYTGTMKLGLETDSYDIEGEIISEIEPNQFSQTELEFCAASFLGDQYQKPPMFSAKKVDGVPLYKHARKGKEIEREDRLIRISNFKVKSDNFPEINFEIDVSKGTYIRTIVHDFGKKLECGACLTELRRTSVGDFRIEQALTLEELAEASSNALKSRLVPLFKVLPSYVLN